jgi:hypothetical protein
LVEVGLLGFTDRQVEHLQSATLSLATTGNWRGVPHLPLTQVPVYVVTPARPFGSLSQVEMGQWCNSVNHLLNRLLRLTRCCWVSSGGHITRRLHRTAQATFDWSSVALLLVLIDVAVLAKSVILGVRFHAGHHLRLADSHAAGETRVRYL